MDPENCGALSGNSRISVAISARLPHASIHLCMEGMCPSRTGFLEAIEDGRIMVVYRRPHPVRVALTRVLADLLSGGSRLSVSGEGGR
jgi:hypothetical protein